MPSLGILELDLWKRLKVWNNTFEFVQLENSEKKQNSLNLGPKMLYLGIFGLEF